VANLDGFDASQVEPDVGFPVVPAGDYEVVITESKLEPTKKGDGKYLKLTLQIINGPEQNKKIFDQLNTQNPSEIAQKIGRAALSSICRAVNVLTPKDSAELHMKPLRAKVIVNNDPQYGMKNEVKSYHPRSGVATQVSNPLAVAPSSQVPSGATPW
jgi:hypothetical protein